MWPHSESQDKLGQTLDLWQGQTNENIDLWDVKKPLSLGLENGLGQSINLWQSNECVDLWDTGKPHAIGQDINLWDKNKPLGQGINLWMDGSTGFESSGSVQEDIGDRMDVDIWGQNMEGINIWGDGKGHENGGLCATSSIWAGDDSDQVNLWQV